MMALVGLSNDDANKGRRLALFAALDCLLAAPTAGTITPLFFALNLILYFVSGSKTIISYLSSISPAGCYTSVLKWFKDKTSKEVVCPADNDVNTFFDNNQVLARNWRVRYNAKAMLSVITSVIHIKQSIVTNFQNIPELDPYSWLYNTQLPIGNIIESIHSFTNDSCERFESLRNSFIVERLNKVYLEQKQENEACSDIIDALMNNDNFDLPPNPTNKDTYSFLDHHHPQLPPKVTIGEPCFENPFPYDAVETVLRQLIRTTSVGDIRKWTIIGCDGLPYLLASRLLEKT